MPRPLIQWRPGWGRWVRRGVRDRAWWLPNPFLPFFGLNLQARRSSFCQFHLLVSNRNRGQSGI